MPGNCSPFSLFFLLYVLGNCSPSPSLSQISPTSLLCPWHHQQTPACSSKDNNSCTLHPVHSLCVLIFRCAAWVLFYFLPLELLRRRSICNKSPPTFCPHPCQHMIDTLPHTEQHSFLPHPKTSQASQLKTCGLPIIVDQCLKHMPHLTTPQAHCAITHPSCLSLSCFHHCLVHLHLPPPPHRHQSPSASPSLQDYLLPLTAHALASLFNPLRSCILACSGSQLYFKKNHVVEICLLRYKSIGLGAQ